MAPLRTAGAAAYDWLAPKVGLPKMTPEQRSDIIGQQGPVAQITASVPGPNPMSTPPTTPIGQKLDMPIQSAIGAASLGPGGLIRRTALGAAGGAAGEAAASAVPSEYAPFVGMLTNALVQGGGSLPRPGATVDPTVANIAQTARAQGVPFTAADITPNSMFRTPASVRATSDAVQGNIISDLGGNPNTGDPVTTNRITPAFMKQVRTDTGNGLDAMTGSNDITLKQSYALLGKLAQADNDIDNVVGVTPADKVLMRQRVAEVRQAINRNTGTMAGTDYQSLVKSGSPLDNLQSNNNSDVAGIGRQVMDATRDAFQNSLSPDDAATYSNLRYRWRLMKTLEPLVSQQQGQSIPMSDLAQQIYQQSQHFDLGNRSMAYTGGGRLGDYMSQAQLIAGGPTPQSGSMLSTLANPQAMTSAAISPHPGIALAAQVAPRVVEGLLGPIVRSGPRTSGLIDSAINPSTRLQRALAALAAAGTNP
jgi:hypothetical protein